MIRLNDVTKTYKKSDVPALAHVSLAIARGERVALTGRSGSGKTTLLNILGGLELPTSGEFTFEGKRMGARALLAHRRHSVGFMFQDCGLVDEMDVYENVDYAGRLHPGKLTTAEMLCAVGLSDKLHSMPENLSGGERQRVALARALVKSPALLLLDEPTGALDAETAHEVMALAFALTKEFSNTLVLVTHDMALAKLTDRIVTLEHGRVVKDSRNEQP